MGTTAFSGPLWSTGSMDYLLPAYGSPVPDYNPDGGPSVFYMGDGIPDVRFVLQKNKLNGFKGVQPAFIMSQGIEVVDAVPSAFGAAKIAALQHATSGTALTLVSANGTGITTNVPIAPFSGAVNGKTIVIAPVVLDFGFAFGTTVAGNKTITVADSTQFFLGMPLCIPGAASATSALLTFVTGLPTATTITVFNAPSVSATLAIGTGDIWPGAPLSTPAQQAPLGHLPYLGHGPGLFFDPSQALARGVSITASSASGVGGNVVVSGWDVYWEPMTETIAVAPGTALVTYGKKAFKAIKSVTPAFTDATYNYSVGTSDVFGYNLRARLWERTVGFWAGATTSSSTGFTPFTTPATGDVRGTLQVSAQGGGTGYGSTNSNGALSGLVMTGNRLALIQSQSTSDTIAATVIAPQSMFGLTQT